MKRKHRLKTLVKVIFWGFFLTTCGWIENTSQAQSPNVIFILTDDQGYGDLSPHGNPIIETPNLDKLYNESIRFTDYHVAPMCTPTRGELMTGQYAYRNGAVFVTQGKSHIHRDIPTMADFFSANGYATGHFGKWHLGDNYPYRPQDRGFQETVHHGAWGVTSMVDYWSNNYFNDTYLHNGEWEQYQGYTTDVWFNQAMQWMKTKAKSEKPFFTYLATNVPHMPLIVEKKYREMYKDEIPIADASFYGMISQFDENLGRLETFLEENGLKENTILIFMGDNGTAQGENVYNAGMRGKKTEFYEGGHRVPFFLRWPAQGIDQPRDIDELTHSTDLLPTLIDLLDMKKTEKTTFDGQSLAPLIRGEKEELPDRKLVIDYRELNKESSAVLWNKWRLVNYDELYNLEQDPGQQQNVAARYPEVFQNLQKHYQQWHEQMQQHQEVDYISIGTSQEKETALVSANWTGDYADSWWNIQENAARFGHFDLQVEASGTYEISLHRWPKASKQPLDGNLTLSFIDGERIHGEISLEALPVRKVRLKIGEKVLTKDTAPGDTHATFEVTLKEGENIRLAPVLLDEEGDRLCGAYFTYVKKI